MPTRTMLGVVLTAMVLFAAPTAFGAPRAAAPAGTAIAGAAPRSAPLPPSRAAGSRTAHAARGAGAAARSRVARGNAGGDSPRPTRPRSPQRRHRAPLPHGHGSRRGPAKVRAFHGDVSGSAAALPGRPDAGERLREGATSRIAAMRGCLAPGRGPPAAARFRDARLHARPHTLQAALQAAPDPFTSGTPTPGTSRPRGTFGAAPRTPVDPFHEARRRSAVDTPTASRAGAACSVVPPKRGEA